MSDEVWDIWKRWVYCEMLPCSLVVFTWLAQLSIFVSQWRFFLFMTLKHQSGCIFIPFPLILLLRPWLKKSNKLSVWHDGGLKCFLADFLAHGECHVPSPPIYCVCSRNMVWCKSWPVAYSTGRHAVHHIPLLECKGFYVGPALCGVSNTKDSLRPWLNQGETCIFLRCLTQTLGPTGTFARRNRTRNKFPAVWTCQVCWKKWFKVMFFFFHFDNVGLKWNTSFSHQVIKINITVMDNTFAGSY